MRNICYSKFEIEQVVVFSKHKWCQATQLCDDKAQFPQLMINCNFYFYFQFSQTVNTLLVLGTSGARYYRCLLEKITVQIRDTLNLHGGQGLLEQGARTIALVGLPPMGCLPAVITLTSGNASHSRGCIESLSSIAVDYNQKLRTKLNDVKSYAYGTKIVYADIYKPMNEIIRNPSKFGKLVAFLYTSKFSTFILILLKP